MPERGEVPVDVVGVAKKQEKQVSSESFLEPILNKPLTVERIDNYADDAVNELIFLLNQRVDDYRSSHNTGGWDDQSIENAALRFYGLESVNSYLDFLAEKDAEIRSLNGIIKKVGQVGEVIVRPDSYNPNIVGGNGGEIKEKKMISRVKTVLFILKEDFEVDVNDESQLTLKKGILKDNMMRKTSYFLISVPKIDRTLLVCDEEGNASYVFDNKVLKDRGIFEDILINLTKEELNELMQQTPELGKRVVYSKDGFVPRMISAIENPDSKKPDEITKEMGGMGKYLYPKAEKDELSCSKLARKLMIGNDTLSELIDQIDPEELGEVKVKRFISVNAQAYTPEQQALIIKKAEDQGLLIPKAAENELSCNKLAEKLGIVHSAVLGKLIDQINPEELGEVNLRKFGSSTTQAYTPEQQALIIKKAEDQGLLAPKAEKNELSCSKLARKLGTDPATLSNLINQIDPEELGEVNLRKFGSNTTQAYTPEQQALIIKKAEDQGLLAPEAAEDELSCNQLAEKLGTDSTTLSKLINQIDPEELGEVSLKKHNTRSAQTYTPEQQALIIKKAEDQGLLAPEAEKNELSYSKLSRKLGISYDTLVRFINNIDPEELGEVKVKRFKSVNAQAYTIDQQWKIVEYIRKYKKDLISGEKWKELDEEKRKWMESRTEE